MLPVITQLYDDITRILLLTTDHVYSHGLNLIPTWIDNHMPNKVCDEITNSFQNVNGFTVEVWQWIYTFSRFFNGCYHLSML